MNKLLKMYHPDKNPNVTEEEYKLVKRMWDLKIDDMDSTHIII